MFSLLWAEVTLPILMDSVKQFLLWDLWNQKLVRNETIRLRFWLCAWPPNVLRVNRNSSLPLTPGSHHSAFFYTSDFLPVASVILSSLLHLVFVVTDDACWISEFPPFSARCGGTCFWSRHWGGGGSRNSSKSSSAKSQDWGPLGPPQMLSPKFPPFVWLNTVCTACVCYTFLF